MKSEVAVEWALSLMMPMSTGVLNTEGQENWLDIIIDRKDAAAMEKTGRFRKITLSEFLFWEAPTAGIKIRKKKNQER